jgi:hypothetical protein
MTAILRAGPFARLSSGQLIESFINEPDVFNGDVFPVNCANTISSLAWPWKYNESISKTLITHTGCESTPGGDSPVTSTSTSSAGLVKTATGNFSISDSASSNHEVRIDVSLGFAYQATQSFDVKVTFNISASGDSTLQQDGPMGFLDTFTDSPIEGFPSLSNSVTRTLPPSYVPNFYSAQIFLDGALIDFPSNVCIPNTNTVSVSASLAFEFL